MSTHVRTHPTKQCPRRSCGLPLISIDGGRWQCEMEPEHRDADAAFHEDEEAHLHEWRTR